MFKKLFDFFAGGATVYPPFHQQLCVAGASLGPEESIRTYSTIFEAPRAATRIMGFPYPSSTKPEAAKPDAQPSGFIRHEAIFSHQIQRAIGHELLLNNSSALLGNNSSPMMRHMHDELLLKSILTLEDLQRPDNDLVFIRLSPDSLEHELIQKLPSRNVVLAFRPEQGASDKLLTRCQELRAHGFRLALDDFSYSADLDPLLGLADYARFDFTNKNMLELELQLEQIPYLAEKTLIARNVNTPEMHKIATRLAFRHYQGSHFDGAMAATHPSISHQRAKIIVLMNMLRNHTENSDIEEGMRQDAELSRQLLRYLNAPANGLEQEVDSISGALQTLGRETLYRWLAVLLFCQQDPEKSPEHSHNHALLAHALLRGRLTELFGQHNRSASEKVDLFVTGMFSQLDAIFNMPLEGVLKHFSLSTPVGQALLKNGGPYAPFLKLAIACEGHIQPNIEQHAQIAGIDIEHVNTSYIKALMWSYEIEN